ncbi:MAG TPA: hypothetical protein VFG07_00775 [Thermoplasmata archaeon]|nr:hypothetical protein [Thermoplasmata archaeon]
MNWPPAPGPGPYALSLDTTPFYVLVALLGLFLVMLGLLRRSHPRAERALDGYLEAASVDVAFLMFSILLVVLLVFQDPKGNRTALALYDVILKGYWLVFSIPIVTVGSSVHSRSRGAIPWLAPALAISAVLFLAFFEFYFMGY